LSIVSPVTHIRYFTGSPTTSVISPRGRWSLSQWKELSTSDILLPQRLIHF